MLKVINKTDWNTRDLRKLILAAMKEVIDKDDWRYKKMEVTIEKSKNRLHGYAYLNSNCMRLKLSEGFEPIKLAWLIVHEFFHILGHHHKDMRGHFFQVHQTIETLMSDPCMKWAWPLLNIRKKEVKVKPKKDLQLDRYLKLKSRLEDKQKKMKRLSNQIKKLMPKVKRYENILTAAGKIKEEK